ncbi:Leucine-rich repeat-containing protein 40 [Cytospora mali]|uniref:Leucine-rich repeat-containing protein 40 n=1 Tax=Cytospora mali TaxID=578113 RepID=A0A194W086_CYTMA|nr:Leucine-rich repeat-containing protein 40 [Valsa mali]
MSNAESTDSLSQASPIDDDEAGDGTSQAKSLKPRPSLAERTVETLARLPSSPALRSRASHSNFFELEAPRSPSRPASRTSRPGSSRRSESSNPSLSRPSLSRPGSSAEIGQDISSPFKSQLPPIDNSPLSAASQRSSTPASLEDTNLSAVSPTSTQPTATGGDSPPQFKKASAALREQIANAKAAKRVAAQKVPAQDQAAQLPVRSVGEAPVIPTDDSFDFGLSDDPFNLNRDANSTSKVIKSRVTSARASGRLNIAALGLKEIPPEVLNMYSLESIGKHDGSWAESVDLTRFVAADNELEIIEESVFPDIDPEELAVDEDAQGSIFYGLETLDLHGNVLIALPAGLRRLNLLTSLNLSGNRLANNCLDAISQITSLKDLKLGGNLLWGTLEPCFSRLTNLEILDLHGNNLQKLPSDLAELHRLRILNLSENSFESLPFDVLSKLPLTELNVRKNKLTGVLIDDGVTELPVLQNLDVSSNQLTSLVRLNATIAMPALTQICLSMNRLRALPDVSPWFELINLTADENNINAFPEGFTSLQHLKSADFSSNDIRVVPAEIARMDRLSMLRLSGNPLRDKKFVSAHIDDLKDALAARLDPVPAESDDYEDDNGPIAEVLTSNEANPLNGAFTGDRSATPQTIQANEQQDGGSRTDTDEFATPPTSAQASPMRTRSGSTLTWPVKPGGVLDRANTESSSLHPVACSNVANEHTIRVVQLHHNLFAALPESLSFFAESLTTLSLAHNQLVGENYLGGGEDLDLPSLKELNLSSNHITGLTALVNHLHAPKLEKLDVSTNRIASLPSSSDKEQGGKLLRDAFPNLTVLQIANNHLADLDPESIRGMKIVDAANNDIAHLNPRIGLLGGVGGLERLEVTGNRFRVPRWNVLERGTESTLRWLRGRVPVADMAAWKAERGMTDDEDVSDVE